MSSHVSAGRIASMDQFRGYTVAGMFLVNFLGGYAAIHPILKHNNTYFSYADSIMPSFMFAVGFSFRLTYLRRRERNSGMRTAWTYLRRSLALVVVSLVMYGFGGEFHKWLDFSEMPAEFQPYRERAPRNTSFEFLMKKAEEAHPGKSTREVIAAASKIGEMAGQDQPKEEEDKPRYALAQAAAKIAIDDGQSFVGPAMERKQAWEKLDTQHKLLTHWRIFLAKLLKSDLWETLALIGVTQLVVLPFIACSFGARFCALAALGIVHCVISYWFNWDFLYGINDNWMSKLWMTGENRSWDGGVFGPLAWGVAMMAGTLAYDMVDAASSYGRAAGKLLLWGAAFMVVGYAMSCLTRLYELSDAEIVQVKERRLREDAEKDWLGHVIERQAKQIGERRKPLADLQGPINEEKRNDFLAAYNELSEKPENQGLSKHALADMAQKRQKELPRDNPKLKELVAKSKSLKKEIDADVDRLEGTISVLSDQRRRYRSLELAESPVMPPWSRFKGKGIKDLLVEPPFVAPPRDEPRIDPPPHIEHRPLNYWLMGKRMPSLSFMTFATGFAFALYGVFIVACDMGRMRIGVFRTFGMNALAAYFLHHVVDMAVGPLVPRDAHLWYCLAGFALFFWITYLCVRYLEKRDIYLKL